MVSVPAALLATLLVAAAGTRLTPPSSSQGHVAALAQEGSKAGSKKMPTTVHDKIKGAGYDKGSFYYDKQQALAKGRKYTEPTGSEKKGDIPISTTMYCISNLCLQYFIIYTILIVVQGMRNFSSGNDAPSKLENLLEACTHTVSFCPMLAVLFLGTRMRAIQLSGGQTEKYNLPQDWVQHSMQYCTWAVLGQLIMVIVTPLVTGSWPKGSDEAELIPSKTKGVVFYVLQGLRYVIMVGLYGGFITIVVGIHMMEVPKEVYPSGEVPVSPAVQCTISLATLYFVVYFLLCVFSTMNEMQNVKESKASQTFTLAAYAVQMCPMLCVLFIGARMRALAMGLDGPQEWAQNCFFACTVSVWIQVILVILVPMVLGGQVRKGGCEGDIRFETPASSAMATYILTALRWVCLLALYVGFTAVIISTLTIEHPKGEEYTPDLAPAMLCVTTMTVQYFTIYLLLWIVITMNQFAKHDHEERVAKNVFLGALESARASVQFCPMLSVLFLGVRMRALQITDKKGAPQGWAQDCMFLATVSVLLQGVAALVAGFLGGEKGVEKSKAARGAAMGAEGFRFLLTLIMHGGATAVVVALFLMTPENATGRGSMLADKVANTESSFF